MNLSFRHNSRPFAKRAIQVHGEGVIELKPSKTKKTQYVTNLNEFNPDFTFTPEERHAEIERRKAHDAQIRLNHIKTTFGETKRTDEIGIEQYDEELTLSISDMKLAKKKLKSHKDDVLLQSRLSTRHQQTAQRRTDYKSFVEADDERVSSHWAKLKPSELHMITLEPNTINFGEVVTKTPCDRNITIVNNHSADVLVQFDHTKDNESKMQFLSVMASSFIVPALSTVDMPIIFESDKLGVCRTSIQYSLNKCFQSNIQISVNVVRPYLKLRDTQIKMHFDSRPNQGLKLAKSITLENETNANIEFKWSPIIGPNGMAFCLRPAQGTVRAGSLLNCELSYYPRFNVPSSGAFNLLVDGLKSDQELDCQVDFGRPEASFHDRRINFGTIALNIPTDCQLYLKNTSTKYPAIYQLTAPESPHSLTVEPIEGTLQVGEIKRIRLSLTPSEAGKFDFKLVALLRGGKSSSIRLGGVVSLPAVTVDIERFNFHSVPLRSTMCIPFNVSNHSDALVECSFEQLPSEFTIETDSDQPVQLLPGQTRQLELGYHPTMVSSHEFYLPLTMNKIRTDLRPESTSSARSVWQKMTPSRLIRAAACQQSMRIYPDHRSVQMMASTRKSHFEIENLTDKPAQISFESNFTILHNEEPVIEAVTIDPAIRMRLCIEQTDDKDPGKLITIVQDGVYKYCLNVDCINDLPSITFKPPELVLETGPLDTWIVGYFTIETANLNAHSSLQLELPKLDNTEELKFEFLDQQSTSNAMESIEVRVKYKSTSPRSTRKQITVREKGNPAGAAFVMTLRVSIDNSLMSTYSFLAQPSSQRQIVRVDNTIKLQMEEQSNSDSETSSLMTATPLTTTPLFDHTSVSSAQVQSTSTGMSHSYSLVSFNEQPTVNQYLGRSLDKQSSGAIKLATQKWFSTFAFPGGPLPIDIPAGLSRLADKQQGQQLQKGSSRLIPGIRKELPTVYEMMCHLAGRQLTSMPVNQALPIEPKKRAQQLYWLNDLLLKFIIAQGGTIGSVRPEYLMDYSDYSVYSRTAKLGLLTEVEFNCVSEQSWLDFLLQTYKCLVLPRALKTLKAENQVKVTSNVYSGAELVLLNWLNEQYEDNRSRIWHEGRAPPRWVVNFDYDLMDGLVLGSVFASYCPFITNHLRQMHPDPASSEECLHNGLVIVDIMSQMQIDYDLEATDITDPNPVAMIMLVNHLHEILPKYNPLNNNHSEVVFETCLGQQQTKDIELYNKYKRTLQYRLKFINGKNVFSASDELLVIPPKSAVTVKVAFQPRHLSEERGTLIVAGVNTIAGSTGAQTFSYVLVGRVTSVKPERTIKVEHCIYDSTTVNVPVRNTTTHDGMFNVTIVEAILNHPLPYPMEMITQTNQAISHTPDKSIRSVNEFNLGSIKKLFLRAGEETNIPIQYVPLLSTTKSCYVILENDELGTMISRIVAYATLPQPKVDLDPSKEEVIFWKCDLNRQKSLSINVPLINHGLNSALLNLIKSEMGDKERERRRLTSTLNKDSLLSKYLPAQYIQGERKFKVSSSNPQTFGLESSIIEFSGDGGKLKVFLEEQTEPGRYQTTINLRGFGHSAYDQRSLKIEAIVSQTSLSKELHFEVPTRSTTTQEIPIFNPSPYTWHYLAQLSESSSSFSGLAAFSVYPGETHYYALKFAPLREIDYNDRLTLINQTDGTRDEYVLTGTGQEPKPTAKLVFDQAKCYQRHPGKITLPSLSDKRRVRFQVSSDMPSLLDGPREVWTEPGHCGVYEFNLTPNKVENLTGVIVFEGCEMRKENNPDYDSDDESFGVQRPPELIEVPLGDSLRLIYEVTLNAIQSDPAKVVTISCGVGERQTQSLELFNPTGEELSFTVELDGKGLEGDSTVNIPPNEKYAYQYSFTGQNYNAQNAGKITFESVTTGRFWYQLLYQPLDPIEQNVPRPIEAPFGGWVEFDLEYHNSSDARTSVTIDISNKNFILDPNQANPFELNSGELVKIKLVFIPSSLTTHDGLVLLTSRDMGVSRYRLRALGTLPKPFEATRISGAISQSVTATLPFRNPSDQACYATVSMVDCENNSHASSSSILMRSVTPDRTLELLLNPAERIALSPNEIIDIPISFNPDQLMKRQATVYVDLSLISGARWESNQKLTDNHPFDAVARDQNGEIVSIRFTYPIIGQIESRAPSSLTPLITCVARERTEHRLELVLTGATPPVLPSARLRQVTPKGMRGIEKGDKKLGEYSYGIQFKRESALEDAITIDLIRRNHDQETGHVTLTFNFIFWPTRGNVNESIIVMVQNQQGAQWTFPVKLRVDEPRPDDTIKLAGCEIGTSSQVTFDLYAQSTGPFTARLTDCAEFSISPESGVLNEHGTPFKVTYTPVTYGKKCRTLLIINTPQRVWTYNVIGLPPRPRRKELTTAALVDHNSNAPKARNRPKRSFVRENLQLLQTASSSTIKGIPLNTKPVF